MQGTLETFIDIFIKKQVMKHFKANCFLHFKMVKTCFKIKISIKASEIT